MCSATGEILWVSHLSVFGFLFLLLWNFRSPVGPRKFMIIVREWVTVFSNFLHSTQKWNAPLYFPIALLSYGSSPISLRIFNKGLYLKLFGLILPHFIFSLFFFSNFLFHLVLYLFIVVFKYLVHLSYPLMFKNKLLTSWVKSLGALMEPVRLQAFL